VVLSREFDEGSTSFHLDVGCVNDSKFTGGQSLGGDEIEDLERIFGCREIVLVIAN